MVLSVFRVPLIRIGRFQMGGYCFFALVGAVLLIAFGCVSPGAVLAGIFNDTAVNPVKILVLFLTMTVFSIYLDELGFFRYLAAFALRRAGRSQRVLFVYLYLTVSLLTIFTSNDIIILTFTPFICSFAKHAGIDPVPYLFAEFSAANTWSMVLMIGNPTNVYIAASEGIGFFDYLRVMALPTFAAGIVSFCVLYALFHKTLRAPISAVPETVAIQEKPLLCIGLLHLILCILLLTVSSYIGFEMWAISLSLMVSLFVCVLVARYVKREPPTVLWRSVRRMPWELVPFMLSMFVLVIAMRDRGICAQISGLLGARGAIWTYGVGSFLTANLINNIPMSVLFATLADMIGSTAAAYGSIVGSNLGACLTPVGALAGIMWVDILRRRGVAFDFRDFVKYGAAVSLPALLGALAVLSFVLS